MRFISAVLIALVTFFTTASGQDTRTLQRETGAAGKSEKRIALVIGNGAYTAAPLLKNPPNDARDMGATLKALGFDVAVGINVNQRAFKQLIREFGQKLRAGGSGLFYYAGHGVQSKGRNYLIPVDADIQSEAEVEDAGVDVNLVLNFMDEAQNGLNIVILDACRNNPFARSFRSASNGLAQVDAPTGTLIAYATAPGTVASDGTERNGLYTAELLKQMQVVGQSATDAFMRVRAEVMKQTANKQVPWEASSLIGSFYFRSPKAGNSDAPAGGATVETKLDTSAFELSYWETIKNSTNPEDFKAYLARYPTGQFAELAKMRANPSEPPAKQEEAKLPASEGSSTELAFWDSVKSSTRSEDLQAYIKRYPKGTFIELANNRLQALAVAERDKAREDDVRRAVQEIERQTRTYRVAYGFKAGLGDQFWDATLKLSPGKYELIADDPKVKITWACSSFVGAVVDGIDIREIACGVGKCRLRAASAADAAGALDGVRKACGGARQGWVDSEAEYRYRLGALEGKSGPIATLGTNLNNITLENAVKLRVGSTQGALVVGTLPGSPGERAGIRTDDVVIAFDGTAIRDKAMLFNLVMNAKPDSNVDITIVRNGQEQVVRAHLDSISLQDYQAGIQGGLASALLMQEKWAEAEAAFREAIRLNPKDAGFHNDLGVALQNQKRLPEAAAQYQEAVQLAPSVPLYQENLKRVKGKK